MAWRYQGKTFINKSAEEIFPYLSTASGLNKWFLRKCQLVNEPGGALEMTWATHTTMKGKVIEIVPDRKFIFEWCDDNPHLRTHAEFRLEPQPNGGTLVHFEDGNFLEELKYVKDFQGVTAGWTEFLFNLKSVVMHGIDLRDEWT